MRRKPKAAYLNFELVLCWDLEVKLLHTIVITQFMSFGAHSARLLQLTPLSSGLEVASDSTFRP